MGRHLLSDFMGVIVPSGGNMSKLMSGMIIAIRHKSSASGCLGFRGYVVLPRKLLSSPTITEKGRQLASFANCE